MNNQKRQFNRTETQDLYVEIEQHRRKLFLRHMIGSAVGSSIIAFIMTFTLWDNAASNISLLIWLVCITLFIAFRMVQGYNYYHSPINSKKAHFWQKLIHIYTIGAGLTWGISAFIFQPTTTHELVLSALYSCGLIAAAVVSLSIRMQDYLLFTSSIAICMISYHFMSDYPYSNLTALLFFIYFVSSTFFARNVNVLQNASNNLIKKNIELIDKLTIEKENAERSNKEKTHFIANASHDLRQPLHALGLYLDSLGSERSQEERQQVLKKSKSSLKSLDDLFSSLLDISNIDAGAITIAPLHFRVSQLFEQIMEQVKGSASEKNIIIESDATRDQIVFCDPVLAARCLRNVVINAIKHSECSTIHLKSESLDNHILICVCDNGKGIPEKDINIVFEEFEQLDNPNRDRQKGLGLGLTIVKRLFELQDHSFELKSGKGLGTEFYFTLPYGNARFVNNILYHEKRTQKIEFKKSILVIDDEQQVLDGMGIILNDWQQNTWLANSIEQAAKALNDGFQPDVIISDYRLENNTTGAEAIAEIKNKLASHTQIVFITGETEPTKIKEIRSHGYPLIHKPIMGAGLKSILMRLNNSPELGQLKVSGLKV